MNPVVVIGETLHKPSRKGYSTFGGVTFSHYVSQGDLPLRWFARCTRARGYVYLDAPVLSDHPRCGECFA